MNKPDIRAAARHLLEDCRRAIRASNARRALPPGSSRARVTTANANWASACEQRDTSERVLESIGGAEVVPLVKEVARLERMHGKGHESTKVAVTAMRAALRSAEVVFGDDQPAMARVLVDASGGARAKTGA